MIRCLIILHSFGGGAEKVALDLAARLDKRRFSPVLVCIRHLPALQGAVPQGIPFFMPSKPGYAALLGFWVNLLRMARQSDVVLGSLELQSIFCAALLAPGRSVAWLHKNVEGYLAGKPTWYACIYKHLLGWALRRSCFTACVSQGILASSARLWPDLALEGGSRLRLLWNPLDVEGFRARAAAPLPEALRVCFSKPVVLAVGRLEAQKAFHILVEAHALLLAGGCAYHLCILGEGSERERLLAQSRDLGITAGVFLPGFMDPAPIMARAAVLALSSVFEGLPLVLVEALSVGLPVVSTDCPSGPAEVLESGKYGALTPVGDARALADALAVVLATPPTGAAREACRKKAEAFAPTHTVAAWENALAEAAQARCNGRAE